jgi:hypothetical protein
MWLNRYDKRCIVKYKFVFIFLVDNKIYIQMILIVLSY